MLTLPFDVSLSPEPFRIATYPPGASFGPRPLRDWEFVWMLEGDALYTRDGNTVAAPAGAVVLCRPGATDFFRWDPDKRTRHGYFHFDLRGAIPGDWPPSDDWPLVRTPDSGRGGDLFAPLFRHLLAWGNEADPLQRQLAVLSLLAAFVTAGQAVESGRAALPEAVARALAYMELRLDQEPAAPIRLGEIADAACVTPQYLCRLFRAATGYSPAETVLRSRLERARTLLTRSNYSVAEVASMCGFASPFHFSRRCKAAFGLSPRELRRPPSGS